MKTCYLFFSLVIVLIAVNCSKVNQQESQGKNNYDLCEKVYDSFGVTNLLQIKSNKTFNMKKKLESCEKMPSPVEKSNCENMAELLQTMARSKDFIPIIEKLRRMRRDLERIEKEFDDERRRKIYYDKTKTQLLYVISNVYDKLKTCKSRCKMWCNEIIIVLLTKLKLSQQRLTQVRIDIQITREKIAILFIYIQHFRITIEKMSKAIIWMYTKIKLILLIIGKFRIFITETFKFVCTKWLRNLVQIREDMDNWCSTKITELDEVIAKDYRVEIAAEAHNYQWGSFSKETDSLFVTT